MFMPVRPRLQVNRERVEKRIGKEENLHFSVCTYISIAYPKAIFNTDLSGLRMTMNQAKKAKGMRSSRSFPDLVIYEPRNGYSGLFIELKRDKTRLFSKEGKPATRHIAEQQEMIEQLRSRGYAAHFAVGFGEAKKIIDNYMKK